MAYHQRQPNHTYGSHGDSLVGSASTGAEASGYNASGNAPGRKSGERRRRKSSTYAMNIDPPNEYQSAYDNNGQQSISTYQSQVSGRSNDYYAYATTTAQMVDPWAFNHANLLANLSQLPPDLLPSL
ncbi:hypothetical protein IWW35_003416, partial [Coemansia sp. RSA 1878]